MKNFPQLRALVGETLLSQLGEEYLCAPQQLIAPQGKQPQKKLGLMRRFQQACPNWWVEPVGRQNIDAAYSLERQWQSQQENPQQLEFVRRCFRDFFQSGMVGCLLWDGARPVGYALVLPTDHQGAFILALRTLAVPAGVVAVLYRETARLLLTAYPGMQWVNLGFLGGQAEQNNRLSYQPQVDKDSLRRVARRDRGAILPAQRTLWDSELAMGLLALPQYQAAERVYCYLSVGSEVSTMAVVAHALLSGKEVAVPRCRGGSMDFCPFTDYAGLERDRMGILQPGPEASCAAPLEDERTICITPALLVDDRGMRLGYGGGYYDRFLTGYRGFAVTLAYPGMCRASLPAEAYDRGVHCVLVPGKVRLH